MTDTAVSLPPTVADMGPSAASNPVAPSSTARPEPRHYTVLSESALNVRIREALSTKENRTGDRFHGVLASEMGADGSVVFPQGSVVVGRIVEARRAGLFGRHSVLSLELTAVTAPDGRSIPLKTTQWYGNGNGGRLMKVPFRGKNKESSSDSASLENQGSDIALPATAAITFRLISPVTVP